MARQTGDGTELDFVGRCECNIFGVLAKVNWVNAADFVCVFFYPDELLWMEHITDGLHSGIR